MESDLNPLSALTSTIWASQDMRRGMAVCEQFDYGMVGLNRDLASDLAAPPFGGTKQSGVGREGSNIGIDEYIETKYIALGGI